MFSPATITAVNTDPGAAVVLVMVRNERARLPDFLRHYRAMGISCFVALDNGSTDGTSDYLAAQPDVLLAQTVSSFAAARFGVDWLNAFHAAIAPGKWVLFADADELLLYRGWPQRPLADLLGAAEATGADALAGFMLDFYPDGAIDTAQPTDGASLLALAPMHDGEYAVRYWPHRPWQSPNYHIEILGGPRLRLVSSLRREAKSGWFDYMVRGQLDRFVDKVPGTLLPTVVRHFPKRMPALGKIPLIRAGAARYTSNHTAENMTPAKEGIVFAHFKFLADFAEKVRVEAARGEHFARGAEYIFYADMLHRHGALDLRYPGSVRFGGADDLAARDWFDLPSLASASRAA